VIDHRAPERLVIQTWVGSSSGSREEQVLERGDVVLLEVGRVLPSSARGSRSAGNITSTLWSCTIFHQIRVGPDRHAFVQDGRHAAMSGA